MKTLADSKNGIIILAGSGMFVVMTALYFSFIGVMQLICFASEFAKNNL